MNLETIDEFLFVKASNTIKVYFDYLNQGFELIDSDSKEIPVSSEHLLKKHFDKDSIEYQVVCTTFVSEIFHITEIYLKSNLIRVGEYLIYPSIDKYPESKEKLETFNQSQKKQVKDFLVEFAKASRKGKKDKLHELSKTIGKTLFVEDKDIIVNSITCSEALFRLEKYLNWSITLEVKERFKLFIENRNEIIHFNKLTNLTFACSHSLFVLMNLSGSNKKLYPEFSSIVDLLTPKMETYNILIQEILFNTESQKVIKKVTDNVEVINNEISKNLA